MEPRRRYEQLVIEKVDTPFDIQVVLQQKQTMRSLSGGNRNIPKISPDRSLPTQHPFSIFKIPPNRSPPPLPTSIRPFTCSSPREPIDTDHIPPAVPHIPTVPSHAIPIQPNIMAQGAKVNWVIPYQRIRSNFNNFMLRTVSERSQVVSVPSTKVFDQTPIPLSFTHLTRSCITVRMLLKSGYRHVYISRKFALKHGFIPQDAAPGPYGYGGLVNIGVWPISLTAVSSPSHVLAAAAAAPSRPRTDGAPPKKRRSKPTCIDVYLSEEQHFDVVLGRSFFERRRIKTNALDPTDVVCLDTGEKLECELVILKDGRGEIVTVT